MDEMINQYKNLWQKIFQDNAWFVDNYFALFFNEQSFKYLATTFPPIELQACLLNCGYDFLWQNQTLKLAYLSGILTNEKFRKQGLANKLITQTLRDDFKDNYSLGALITFDENLVKYYQKFGFVSVGDRKEAIFNRREVDKNCFDRYIFVKDADITDIRYRRFFACRDNATVHNEKTLKLYNGKDYYRYVLLYQGTVRAIAIAAKEKYFMNFLDFVYCDADSKKAMLSFVAKQTRRDIRLNYGRYDMIRVVNARKILEVYAANNYDAKFSLHINDPLIEENNITVQISNGKVTDIEDSYKVRRMDIEEMTMYFFDKSELYLMLDK